MEEETDKIIRVPELGLPSQLLDQIRLLVADPKYDRLTVAELVGVLEMLSFEYRHKWMTES